MSEQKWSEVIKPSSSLLSLNLKELWRYKDLLVMFVKRDFVSVYKQTVLGPLWFFIQPIFTTAIYVLIFGKLAKISPEGVPQILFFMAGTVFWSYFSDCLLTTSKVFETNKGIFGKVYFPRLISPISVVVSKLLKLGIQLILFIGFFLYYLIFKEASVSPNIYIYLLPFLILIMAALSLGLGLITTSLTTKYKDLNFLLQFGIQLAMYGAPVIYSLEGVKEREGFLFENVFAPLLEFNPLTPIFESFRYGFLGNGTFSIYTLAYSTIVTIIVLFIGMLVFNKTQKSFMDTV